MPVLVENELPKPVISSKIGSDDSDKGSKASEHANENVKEEDENEKNYSLQIAQLREERPSQRYNYLP